MRKQDQGWNFRDYWRCYPAGLEKLEEAIGPDLRVSPAQFFGLSRRDQGRVCGCAPDAS